MIQNQNRSHPPDVHTMLIFPRCNLSLFFSLAKFARPLQWRRIWTHLSLIYLPIKKKTTQNVVFYVHVSKNLFQDFAYFVLKYDERLRSISFLARAPDCKPRDASVVCVVRRLRWTNGSDYRVWIRKKNKGYQISFFIIQFFKKQNKKQSPNIIRTFIHHITKTGCQKTDTDK